MKKTKHKILSFQKLLKTEFTVKILKKTDQVKNYSKLKKIVH